MIFSATIILCLMCILTNVVADHVEEPQLFASHLPMREAGHLLRKSYLRQRKLLTINHLNKNEEPIIKGKFLQKLDHFNSSDTRRFQQKFYKNNKHYKGNEVIFLSVGGEGGEDGILISSSYLLNYAKAYGATLYVLEHRYYGESQPFRNYHQSNYKYLSSKQALADLANFIRFVNYREKMKNPKWVVFGGSYAGNLAAWMRLKYPELVIGAVASSAPVQAEADFPEMYETIEKVVVEYGTQNCSLDIRRYFSAAQKLLLTKGGRAKLGIGEEQEVFTDENVYSFLSERLYFLENSVQSDSSDHNGLMYACQSFKTMADAIEDGNSTVEVVATQWATPSASLYQEDDGRSWFWQICSEFGYFYTTATNRGSDSSIFDDAAIPFRYFVGLCAEQFGPEFTEESINKAVRRTNLEYGGAHSYNATQVVFVNGSEDPWHLLSLYETLNDSVKSILIQGTSHCADFYSENIGADSQGLKNARERIKLEIGKWLQQTNNR